MRLPKNNQFVSKLVGIEPTAPWIIFKQRPSQKLFYNFERHTGFAPVPNAWKALMLLLTPVTRYFADKLFVRAFFIFTG
jgi:hypothetical protein